MATVSDTTAGFRQLFERHKDALFRICSAYAADEDDAADLLQETFIQVWKSLPKFRGDSSTFTWLYRITINVCLRRRYLRRREERVLKRLDGFDAAADETAGDDNSELLAKLRACVQTLEPAERSLVVLFLEDLPYREIGAVLGISENHVAVKIKRIKSRLLNCVNKET